MFSVRSPFTLCALSVHNYAFTIYHLLTFVIHKAYIVHSRYAYHAFDVRSAFSLLSLHCHSELKSERIDLHNEDKKKGVHKNGRKLSYYIRFYDFELKSVYLHYQLCIFKENSSPLSNMKPPKFRKSCQMISSVVYQIVGIFFSNIIIFFLCT